MQDPFPARSQILPNALLFSELHGGPMAVAFSRMLHVGSHCAFIIAFTASDPRTKGPRDFRKCGGLSFEMKRWIVLEFKGTNGALFLLSNVGKNIERLCSSFSLIFFATVLPGVCRFPQQREMTSLFLCTGNLFFAVTLGHTSSFTKNTMTHQQDSSLFLEVRRRLLHKKMQFLAHENENEFCWLPFSKACGECSVFLFRSADPSFLPFPPRTLVRLPDSFCWETRKKASLYYFIALLRKQERER